jgi:hypothetical protein
MRGEVHIAPIASVPAGSMIDPETGIFSAPNLTRGWRRRPRAFVAQESRRRRRRPREQSVLHRGSNRLALASQRESQRRARSQRARASASRRRIAPGVSRYGLAFTEIATNRSPINAPLAAPTTTPKLSQLSTPRLSGCGRTSTPLLVTHSGQERSPHAPARALSRPEAATMVATGITPCGARAFALS